MRWIAHSGAFNARRFAGLLAFVGHQRLCYRNTEYTVFGLTGVSRAIAVPDGDARPVMLSLDYMALGASQVRVVERMDEERLELAYATTVADLVQRLAEQSDQTRAAFNEALGLWLDTGLLPVGGLPLDLIRLYLRVLPNNEQNSALLSRLRMLQRADEERKIEDNAVLREALLDAITQLARFQRLMTEKYMDNLASA